MLPSFEKRIFAGAEPEPFVMFRVTIVVFVYVGFNVFDTILAAFEDEYRAQLERHDAVVSVSLASRLSGTYEVARRAAQSFRGRPR